MNDINLKKLDSYSQTAERELKRCFETYGGSENDYQHEITEAMWYSVSAGGKRIRPVLVMEFCRICGGDAEKAYSAASAIEMIHTFSLIHDDLPCMDNDDLRRGKPSCHKAFREDIALLAGDALENLAYNVIADDTNVSAEARVRMIRCLSQAVGTDGMIGGQVIDAYNTNSDFSDEKLLKMYSMKTSALLSAACQMGCICAERYDMQEKAAEYAENLGLAFQICDDILDVCGDEKLLGKPIGSDEKSGKSTFVAIKGLEEAEKAAIEYTNRALGALDGFDDTDFLRELTEMLLHRHK